MRHLICAGLALFLCAATPAEEVKLPEPIDLETRTVSVLGVYTPVILSPTGSLNAKEPYSAAKEDCRARIRAELETLKVRNTDELLQNVQEGTPVYFTDGTVHIPCTLVLPESVELPSP